jgi:hypothetical protein
VATIARDGGGGKGINPSKHKRWQFTPCTKKSRRFALRVAESATDGFGSVSTNAICDYEKCEASITVLLISNLDRTSDSGL